MGNWPLPIYVHAGYEIIYILCTLVYSLDVEVYLLLPMK